ncbi:MAG: DMT family transporter [Bdellovibrionota bacterium]
MIEAKNISIEQSPIKGIFICLLAYFLFSAMGLCEKLISHAVTLPIILFFQNFICLLLTFPAVKKDCFVIVKKEYVSAYILRIFSGLGCYAALFYIIRFIPISEALIYQYAGCMWIPFISFFWLNIRMPKNLWYSILVGFLGIILILKPDMSFFGVVSIVGILCGISQGISMVAIRKLSVYEPISRILFYNFFAATIVTTPLFLKNYPSLTMKDFVLLCTVGITTYLAQKLLTVSLKYANATTLAPICYSSILFTGMFAWIFWHEIPDKITLLGMAFVIFGCLLSLLLNRFNSKSQKIIKKDNYADTCSRSEIVN